MAIPVRDSTQPSHPAARRGPAVGGGGPRQTNPRGYACWICLPWASLDRGELVLELLVAHQVEQEACAASQRSHVTGHFGLVLGVLLDISVDSVVDEANNQLYIYV